ncbi:MAG: PilZ domain-containing protein [Nitrospirae bacterium]|nr:PilZ domain-containing protein [Nitrospirota bacterium]
MEDKRAFERFTRRLEVEFSSGEKNYRGISSDLSERGIFIRTHHGLAPGSTLNITIYLPDGKTSRLKGIVRKIVKTDSVIVKNGMGIELTDIDANYMNFVKASTLSDTTQTGKQGEQEFLIVFCISCGTKNKVPKAKLHMGPRCGNCKSGLKIN